MQRNTHRFGFAVHEYSGLDASGVEQAPAGVLTFDYRGQPLDLLNIPREHDTTVVMFHAALSSRTRALPIFSGVPLSEGLNCNVLCVSDPSLSRRPLELGWHVGNELQPMQLEFPQLLERILHSHGASRVVFLGASGGGFAALRYSRHFPGSLAIAINPQTSIAAYTEGPVKQFTRICFGVESVENLPDWVEHDLTAVYQGEFPNSVAYIQNLGDTHHVRRHLVPFLDASTPQSSLMVKTVDLGRGHVVASTEVIRDTLNAAIESRGDWGDGLEQLDFRPHYDSQTVLRERRAWEVAHA